MKKKVLVMGYTGMLGAMVYDYLNSTTRFELGSTFHRTDRRTPYKTTSNSFAFDASSNIETQLNQIFSMFVPDYIINCIGIIKPYVKEVDDESVRLAISVNALYPHLLSHYTAQLLPETRIVQIVTDCVFDGRKGDYGEFDEHNAIDVYGKSKSLGEVRNGNFLNIRCSFIGPELNNKLGLLEWFLSNANGSVVNGFSDHIWNGVTTLQCAQIMEDTIINDRFHSLRNLNHVIHYIRNTTVSKYTLLELMAASFGKDVTIIKKENSGNAIDRSLRTEIAPVEVAAMEIAIEELAQYCRKSKTFNTINR